MSRIISMFFEIISAKYRLEGIHSPSRDCMTAPFDY